MLKIWGRQLFLQWDTMLFLPRISILLQDGQLRGSDGFAQFSESWFRKIRISPFFSFLWMLIRPKHTFVMGCTSLLFPFDFHLYLVTACYARVDPHAVIPNARAFPPYLCSLASFWDLQFSCPGAGAFLLKSHTIILSLCLGLFLNCATNKTKTGSSFHNITYKTIEILSIYLPYRNIESYTARRVLWRWNHFRLCLCFLLPLS